MRQFGAFADSAVFHFDEVADFDVIRNLRMRPQMNVRADLATAADARFVRVRAMQMRVVADRRAIEFRIRTDMATAADNRAAAQNRPRLENRVLADTNVRVHIGARRIDQRHALRHQFLVFTLPQNRFRLRQLRARIHAERFIAVRAGRRRHRFAGADQQINDIGQIVFTLRVVIGNPL